jgi:four helix bundle protein
MDMREWEETVPRGMREDSVWKVEAYRLGLFLGDIAWEDITKLMRDRRTMEVGDQLCRAVKRISSCVVEGYSRDTGKARSTFYEYALGSARESRDWYFKGRRVLKPAVIEHRIGLCTQIVKLTLRMIANERQRNRRVSESGKSET